MTCLFLGVGFGAATSLVNAVSSPRAAWQSIARFVSFLLDAGWAWAALAVAAGWIVGTRVGGAVGGVISLAAATTVYYAVDALLRQEPFIGYLSEMWIWWLASLLLGSALGTIGASIKRPGVVGLLAGLTVPVAAAVQMVVLPPGLDGAILHPEAVWARWIVWTTAALGSAVVIVHHSRTREFAQRS